MQPRQGRAPVLDRDDASELRPSVAVKITHPMHRYFGRIGVIVAMATRKGKPCALVRVYVGSGRHVTTWAHHRSVVAR